MPRDADKALHLLEEAIRLEPDYAVVHGFIAWCHEQRYLRGGLHAETRRSPPPRLCGDRSGRRRRHGARDGRLCRWRHRSKLRDRTRSSRPFDGANISPSSALAFGFSSIIHAWMGDHAIAIEHSKIGI